MYSSPSKKRRNEIEIDEKKFAELLTLKKLYIGTDDKQSINFKNRLRLTIFYTQFHFVFHQRDEERNLNEDI